MSLSANPPVFSFGKVTPATIRQEANAIKQKFTSLINNIKHNNPSFALLNHALGEASSASAHITLPSMVHGDSEVRAASNAMKDDIKTMFDTALSDNELYNALINRDQGHDYDDDDVDSRFTQNILRIMGRNGCRRACIAATVDQSTIQMKRNQIEEICTAFCAAINEHDGYLLFTEEELEGLGNNDIDMYPHDGTSTKRKIGLKAPSTLPILKFAKNSNTRKQVMEALANKCQEENTPRFLKVLKLRDECAKLLGYDISDGSCLPESTIDALSKSRFLMTGYAKMKYLAMALYDLKVHSGPGPYEFEGKEYDAVSLYNIMIERYTGISPISESFAAASWFHLLMGYDAGYCK